MGFAVTAVHQVVPVMPAIDAVTSDVLTLRARLRERGLDSEVFVLERLPGQDVHLLDRLLEGPAPAAVLFHYAIASPATRRLAGSRLPLVLLDHNTTPAGYYWLIDRAHYDVCRAARTEIALLRERAALALGRSEFTRRELVALGFRRTGVLPILLEPEGYLGHRPGAGAASRGGGGTVILTVGRVAPNKRVDDAIRVLHAYRRGVDPGARLWVVGDYARLPVYRAGLDRVMGRLNEDGVVFTGRVDAGTLRECYATASVYLSMSEHEGFNVPLVEAMLSDLPVVARNAGAAGDTLGDAGLLIDGRDPCLVAEAVARLTADPVLREQQVERGRRRAAELSPDRAVERLLRDMVAAGLELGP